VNRATPALIALPLALIGVAYVVPQSAAADRPLVCTQEGLFGNPADRSMFYACEARHGDGRDLTRSDFQCPPAELWDAQKTACVQLWQLPRG
jgi:hypothetical protein